MERQNYTHTDAAGNRYAFRCAVPDIQKGGEIVAFYETEAGAVVSFDKAEAATAGLTQKRD